MSRTTKISLLLFVAFLCGTESYAQRKKPAKQEPKTKAQPAPDLIERTPVRQPKKDTVEIIYETVPAKQQKKQIDNIGSLLSVKEEIITIPKKDTNRRKNVQIVYDTVKYVKKPKPEENQPGAEDKMKAPQVPAIADAKTAKDTIKEKAKEGFCGCVELKIKGQDTINFEDYINYSFTFKNNCKSEVFVYSYAFRFGVTDYFGKPVKRLRRIDFVKRFDHSEYVRIDPGETYEYRFADDPFFEYELTRGSQYRFTFIHSNTSNKSKIAPTKTYLCSEVKEQIVTVK